MVLADCLCAICSPTAPIRGALVKCLRGSIRRAHSGRAMRATASAMPTQTPPTSPTQVRVPTNPPPVALAHSHTRPTRVHTHTHTHRHTHAHTHAHCNPLRNTRAHEPARTRSHARTLKHTQCHSLARSHWAHAAAHPARWTTCADELLQLRQQLAAQGVELQQLRLSNAALVAAARRRQRAGTATPPRGASSEQLKARPTKVITKAHDGMAELQQEWEEGQDGHLRLRPTEPTVTEAQS
jgi:hypothetical protein